MRKSWRTLLEPTRSPNQKTPAGAIFIFQASDTFWSCPPGHLFYNLFLKLPVLYLRGALQPPILIPGSPTSRRFLGYGIIMFFLRSSHNARHPSRLTLYTVEGSWRKEHDARIAEFSCTLRCTTGISCPSLQDKDHRLGLP